MTFQIRVGSVTAAALLLMAALPASAADTAKVPGDQWEVTTQMSMEGMDMAMPAQTVKVCAPKTWQEPPAPANEQQKCKNSDFKLVGPKATWKVTCSNPPMTGEGEITRDGATAYAGTIKFASSDGNLTIKLKGRRVGDCVLP